MTKRTVVSVKFRVNVTRAHIEEGECGLAAKCMHKLAVAEALANDKTFENADHIRVDGGQIKFTANGYRWFASTPKRAKRSLIAFDTWQQRKEIPCPVSPHSYTLVAFQGTKIQPNSAERQAQINDARRARIADGRPDKKRTMPSLHERVVGLGPV
ncbi:MAG TPA: hypothetical protein VF748_00800 [Candidatus Acidoferrum sp.]